MRLIRPRLLPATIAAMSALLLLKSVLLVQAAAREPDRTPPNFAASSPAATASIASPAATASSASGGPSVQTASSPPVLPMSGSQTSIQPTPPLQMSESERAVLLALRERRATLDARERTLDQRAAELAAANHRLEMRVQELSALQARLEGLESGRQQHRAENWAGLVKTYEAMKPREAAAIFDALDMQVLLQVLDRMQERRAASVLAAMQPDRARLATQLLAEMRTRAITPAEAAPTAPPTNPPTKG